jgi:hypothetical protein
VQQTPRVGRTSAQVWFRMEPVAVRLPVPRLDFFRRRKAEAGQVYTARTGKLKIGVPR